MSTDKHVPSAREQAFLDSVVSPRYERESINGLAPFLNERAPKDVQNFYSKEELDALRQVMDTERDVESRMPVKMTRHYFDLAQKSLPIRNLVKAIARRRPTSLAGSRRSGPPDGLQPRRGLSCTSTRWG